MVIIIFGTAERVRVRVFGGNTTQDSRIRAALLEDPDIEIAAVSANASSPVVTGCDVAVVVADGRVKVPQCCPAVKVVPDARMRRWNEALYEGASAFISLGTVDRTLAAAVRFVRYGALLFDETMARRIARHLREQLVEQQRIREISELQAEILTRIARGETDEEIGRALALSRSRLRVETSRIFSMIGAPNRIAAAAWWARYTVRERLP